MSKRYSIMAGDEFGALENEEDHLNVLFPPEIRRGNMKKNLIWLVINVVSICYICGVVIYFRDLFKYDCVLSLAEWLSVYCAITFL